MLRCSVKLSFSQSARVGLGLHPITPAIPRLRTFSLHQDVHCVIVKYTSVSKWVINITRKKIFMIVKRTFLVEEKWLRRSLKKVKSVWKVLWVQTIFIERGRQSFEGFFRFFVNLDSLLFNAYSFTELHRIPEVIEIRNLNIHMSHPVTIKIYLQNNMCKINNLKVLNM